MSKINFLWTLQNALRWSFSKEEIADILRDYEGFFATGAEDGKNENEICTNLGNPSAIAQELAESLGKKKTRSLSVRIIKRMALAVALFLIVLAYYFALHESGNIIRDSILMLVGFSVVLWFTLGGTFRGAPPVPRNASRKWLLPVGHIVLTAIVAVFFVLLHILNRDLLSGTDVLSYARVVINLRTAFFITALITGAFSIYGFYRLSAQFFTITAHAVGVVSYFSAAYNIMANLNTPEYFYRFIMRLPVIYGVTIVITFLFAAFIRTTSRRGIN